MELKLGVGVELSKKISWEGAKQFLKWEARSAGTVEAGLEKGA